MTMVYGIDIDRYPKGYTLRFRRPLQFQRHYGSYMEPDPLLMRDDLIYFTVGVDTVEWLEKEMKRRIYHPMIETRLDPGRLP